MPALLEKTYLPSGNGPAPVRLLPANPCPEEPGKHWWEASDTIRSASGDATTKFMVEAEIVSPPTGSTNVWVWIINGVVALGVGATVVVFIIRKRKTA
mgnify:CR=1 FL=1